MTQKVFCIGFHKTGTSSLGMALNILGHSVCRRLDMLQTQIPEVNVLQSLKDQEYEKLFGTINLFDAFVDNPWPLLYQELDRAYPNCKFILSVRNEEEWLKSVLNYFSDSSSEIRRIIYGEGSPQGNEQHYLETYRKHNLEVKAYFEDKPERLLVFDVDEQNKWEKLCSFLNCPIPKEPYPFENKTSLTPYSTTRQKKKLTLHRIKQIFKQPFSYQVLAVETFLFLSLARICIVLVPFRKIAGVLGKTGVESSSFVKPGDQLRGIKIGRVIKRVSQFTPFRSLCFEQALACKLMLNRRKMASTIYFGVKKDKTVSSTLQAHAWLRFGQHILTGNRGKEAFSVVSTFGSTQGTS